MSTLSESGLKFLTKKKPVSKQVDTLTPFGTLRSKVGHTSLTNLVNWFTDYSVVEAVWKAPPTLSLQCCSFWLSDRDVLYGACPMTTCWVPAVERVPDPARST